MKKLLPGSNSLIYYKIFIYDISKGADSKFRLLISTALKEYYPIKKELLDKKDRDESKIKAPEFSFDTEWCYDESYEFLPQKKCLLEKFFLKKEYTGKINEVNFAKFLDSNQHVKWWYKNGDSGTENFSLKYFNIKDQEDKLFYPDWIVQFEDGKIGIYDTKAGSTLNTEGRAKGLYDKLVELGENFIGGIVNFENGLFVYSNQSDYNDVSPKNNEWLPFLTK
jgi:type III restriction enzyme